MSRWTAESDFDDVIKASIDSFEWSGLSKDQVFAFIKAIIGQESAFRPGATRGESGGRASVGLMQLLTTTAKGLGYTGDVGDRYQLTGLYVPGTNVFLGVKLLNQLLGRIGPDLAAIASAYNGGYNPSLGFGVKLVADKRICLARDTNGNCTNWYDGKAGQFGNQPYVDAVQHNYSYFFRTAPPVASIGVSAPRDGGEATIGLVVLAGLAAGALLLLRR